MCCPLHYNMVTSNPAKGHYNLHPSMQTSQVFQKSNGPGLRTTSWQAQSNLHSSCKARDESQDCRHARHMLSCWATELLPLFIQHSSQTHICIRIWCSCCLQIVIHSTHNERLQISADLLQFEDLHSQEWVWIWMKHLPLTSWSF